MINAYVPPSASVEDALNKIEVYLLRYIYRKLILVGDFNAKHSIWGRQRIDIRGDYLLEFVN